jgi:hypothetical protein
VRDDLVDLARASFDLGVGDVQMAPAARGALGQVWRLVAGGRAYALKVVFEGTPPGADEVATEVAFARAAAAAGVRLPASHPDRQGGYPVPLAGGGWLRLYDWVDVGPADLVGGADALGVLIAAQLNFLGRQLRVALEPTAPAGDRTWAEAEIDEGLRILPSPDLLVAVLDAVRPVTR